MRDREDDDTSEMTDDAEDLVEVTIGHDEFGGEIRRLVPRDSATHWDSDRWSSRPPG